MIIFFLCIIFKQIFSLMLLQIIIENIYVNSKLHNLWPVMFPTTFSFGSTNS